MNNAKQNYIAGWKRACTLYTQGLNSEDIRVDANNHETDAFREGMLAGINAINDPHHQCIAYCGEQYGLADHEIAHLVELTLHV